MAINLAFARSLRMGELLDLTWSCVDIGQESIDNDCAYRYIDKELQRVSRESLAQIGEIRKVFLPRTVTQILVKRKKTVDELKELLGDEYRDYDLVFDSTQGTPTESNSINRAFSKLTRDHNLPRVVFHNLRHTSTTYRLKRSGGQTAVASQTSCGIS